MTAEMEVMLGGQGKIAPRPDRAATISSTFDFITTSPKVFFLRFAMSRPKGDQSEFLALSFVGCSPVRPSHIEVRRSRTIYPYHLSIGRWDESQKNDFTVTFGR